MHLKQFIEEQKNTHMTHIEDAVIYGGVAGARQAINGLQSMRDMLAGHKKGDVSVKWDGCIKEDTELVTNEGVMTIKQIKESWRLGRELFVLSHDFAKGCDVFCPILDVFASKSKKTWMELQLEGGVIVCTEDHEIMTNNRGWVKACELTSSDDVKECKDINMDDNHISLQIGNENVSIKRITRESDR